MPSKSQSATLAAANAAALTADQRVKGSTWLTVVFRIGSAGTPATAAADAKGVVQVYLEDDQTVPAPVLPTDAVATATLTAGVAEVIQRYRVGGVQKVKISLTNNNATTALPNAQFDWFIS